MRLSEPFAEKLHSPVPTRRMSLLIPGLRRAAPRLAASPFVCRQCLRQQQQPRTAPSRILGQLRYASTESQAKAKSTRFFSASAVPTAAAAAIPEAAAANAKRFFPETSSKSVAYWLIGSAASVFGIVVFGGLTRLTESG